MAVFALGLADGFGKFHLHLALYLDGVVGGAESGEEFGFAHFVHFAFDHHDVVVGGADHEFHVGFLEFVECGVDHELTVHTGHTHFGDGTVEGYVAHGDGGRCGQAGEAVGSVDSVGGEEDNIDEGVGVVIVREKGTEHTVDQTGGEDFIIARAAFALEEAAGETTGSGEFLFVFNLQWHEIDTFSGFLGRYHGGQKHGVAHAHFYRSIGLLCQLAGLDSDGAAVGQFDGFFNGIHKIIKNVLRRKIRAKIRK